jgi:uncharacterized protein YjbI with pentapeptide repeats
MNRPRLTAQALRRRYHQGERHFEGVDLSGESLRGLNLRDIDLSGADLSRCDLRGTRFVNATLRDTVLTQTKAGLQNCFLLVHLAITLTMAAIFNFGGAAFGAVLIATFFDQSMVENFTYIPGLVLIIMMLSTFLSITHQGFTLRALNTMLILSAVVVLATVESSLIVPNLSVGVGSLAILGAFIFVSVFGFAVAVAGLVVSMTASLSVGLLGLVVIVTIAGAGADVVGVSGIGTISVAVIGAGWSGYVAWRALKGDDKFAMVRVFALALGAVGGTSFSGADLTGAYFTQATLKNTNFADSRQRRTHLTRVRWHDTQKLDRARLGTSILQNTKVRDLVVSLNGADQDFSNLTLRGANLAGANLIRANFTGAILSEAVLSDANLQQANLTEASCIGTDFSRADFTGATLEAWNIESTTKLDDAHCDYVYLLRHQQERRPSSGTFGPGEFTKLFQEVLDTIDLIFRNGVDWKAFMHTLQQVQVQYDNADLSVQSIENKGDGVVVVKLNAAPGADKPAIHQAFTEIYQLAFKAAEAQYKAQLHAKDEQISDYRQQNANMQEVVKLLAQRPITVDVTATAESKAMQGNDYSRSVSIGGDATGNVFQSGDGNTAKIEFQQVRLPPPESVNIQAELWALHRILASLNDPVTDGIAQKLEVEAQKPTPNKDVIGQTLETGLTYAKTLQGFAEALDQLKPHVQNAAGWLGQHGHKLLPLVGLAMV